ncbi:MAG: DNA alkylation repair protein [Planctomycetota bacterium]|jgi:3-methyladenine DNA glycosylase AlkD
MPGRTEIMKQLEALGSERFRATFARHGVTGEAFGVPYADLYKLQKQIGVDQALAEKLWTTGNHDARILAMLIADPAQMKATLLDAWAKTATNQFSLDAIAGLAAKTGHGRRCMEKWIKSKAEWTAAAGWHLLGAMACRPDGGGLEDPEYGRWLDHIESRIHDSPNRVRHCMNGALIAIGVRGSRLEKSALAAAKRIGTVQVDHGDTSCKTPDAASYIRKAAARRGGAGTKKKSKKKGAKTQMKATATTRS